MIIFVKLLLAHLLGDFVLQRESWIKDKESKRHRSIKLLLHSVIHGFLSLLLIARIEFWVYALFIAISHWVIDYIKITFQKENTRVKWFVTDQLLHVLVLAAAALLWTGGYERLGIFWKEDYWIYITAVMFITFASSVVIRILISDWNPKKNEKESTSLSNAGKWIGILERLFVFYFILSGHWEAIGFLLAAKSIFRFGDLKEAHDIKLTEYILIGTLLSFGIAILTGILVEAVLAML